MLLIERIANQARPHKHLESFLDPEGPPRRVKTMQLMDPFEWYPLGPTEDPMTSDAARLAKTRETDTREEEPLNLGAEHLW